MAIFPFGHLTARSSAPGCHAVFFGHRACSQKAVQLRTTNRLSVKGPRAHEWRRVESRCSLFARHCARREAPSLGTTSRHRIHVFSFDMATPRAHCQAVKRSNQPFLPSHLSLSASFSPFWGSCPTTVLSISSCTESTRPRPMVLFLPVPQPTNRCFLQRVLCLWAWGFFLYVPLPP